MVNGHASKHYTSATLDCYIQCRVNPTIPSTLSGGHGCRCVFWEVCHPSSFTCRLDLVYDFIACLEPYDTFLGHLSRGNECWNVGDWQNVGVGGADYCSSVAYGWMSYGRELGSRAPAGEKRLPQGWAEWGT